MRFAKREKFGGFIGKRGRSIDRERISSKSHTKDFLRKSKIANLNWNERESKTMKKQSNRINSPWTTSTEWNCYSYLDREKFERDNRLTLEFFGDNEIDVAFWNGKKQCMITNSANLTSHWIDESKWNQRIDLETKGDMIAEKWFISAHDRIDDIERN